MCHHLFVHSHLLRRSRAPRGLTLLEVMLVVAIIGIIGALAVPNLLPLLAQNRLHAQSETVASFLNAVRRKGIAEGRCVRVHLVGGRLVAEVRTSGDCVNMDDVQWRQFSSQSADAATISYVVESLSVSGAPDAKFRLVFRPNGRLRGDGDLTVTPADDGARVSVIDSGLATESRSVLVTSTGLVCVVRTANPPPALPASITCS